MSKKLVLILALFSYSLNGQKNLERFLTHPAKAELQKVDLSNCDLDSLPKELALCVNLVELDLSDNNLRELPSYLKNFSSLRELKLQENLFTSFPSSMVDAPKLERLLLAQNPITSLKLAADAFPQLLYLDLWDCDIQEIDPSICQHPKLEEIDLRRNFLGTRDLEWLFECTPKLKIRSTWGCNCD
jgi:Leucine-rich repeat (LRR) protein